MMSQNRQQDVDRKQAAADYQVNVKAELESNCCTRSWTSCGRRKSSASPIQYARSAVC
jgi:uncharacterized membrane protein